MLISVFMRSFRFVYFIFFIIIFSRCDGTSDISNSFERDGIRVLDIGNSYTDDVTMLLPHIVNSLNVDLPNFTLYKVVRGGASFRTWCDVYNNCDNQVYTVQHVIGDLPPIVKAREGKPMDGSLFRELLTNEKWDYVIIHPLSNYAPYYYKWNEDSLAGGLEDLLSIIHKNQPNVRIGTYLVHSYSSNYHLNIEKSSYNRWELIAKSISELKKQYDIDLIIPYGTAIQNLRASSLNNEYDLTRDGTHCGYGLCCYTAACCYYEAVLSPFTGVHVLGSDMLYDLPIQHRAIQSSIDVTKKNAIVAQMAAMAAMRDYLQCVNPEMLTDL